MNSITESYKAWLIEQEELNEIFSPRLAAKAWSTHIRAERKRGNPLFHPAVSPLSHLVGGAMVHNAADSAARAIHHFASGNHAEGAMHAVAAAGHTGISSMVLGDHFKETAKIYKNLRFQEKQKENADSWADKKHSEKRDKMYDFLKKRNAAHA